MKTYRRLVTTLETMRLDAEETQLDFASRIGISPFAYTRFKQSGHASALTLHKIRKAFPDLAPYVKEAPTKPTPVTKHRKKTEAA